MTAYLNQCTRCFRAFTSRSRRDAVCGPCAEERARLTVRRHDPEPAREAAVRIEQSGVARSHRDRIRWVLRHHPEGLTAHDIARKLGDINNVAAQRRISELTRDGEVAGDRNAHCACHGRLMTAWRLSEYVAVAHTQGRMGI